MVRRGASSAGSSLSSIDAVVQAVRERQFSIHGEIGPQVVQVIRVEFIAGAVNAAARDHLAQGDDCYLRVVCLRQDRYTPGDVLERLLAAASCVVRS